MANHRPQPPPPSPPPPSQHPAYAGVAAMTTNFLPNTANQADMQHVLNLVKELSDIQAANRQETARLIETIHHLGDRQKSINNKVQAINDGQGSSAAEAAFSSSAASSIDPIDHARVQHQLKEVTQERDNLKTAFDDVAETLTQYEDTLESIMVRVREFANQHTSSLIAWHKHYNTALQTERDANHQLRLEHSHWQESVGKLGEYIRGAFDAQNTLLLPYEREIAGLKRVNKVLKRRCGLNCEKSDDEDETAPPAVGEGAGPSQTHLNG